MDEKSTTIEKSLPNTGSTPSQTTPDYEKALEKLSNMEKRLVGLQEISSSELHKTSVTLVEGIGDTRAELWKIQDKYQKFVEMQDDFKIFMKMQDAMSNIECCVSDAEGCALILRVFLMRPSSKG